jgi:hypothetical protein
MIKQRDCLEVIRSRVPRYGQSTIFLSRKRDPRLTRESGSILFVHALVARESRTLNANQPLCTA